MRASCRYVQGRIHRHFDSADPLREGSEELTARRGERDAARVLLGSAGAAHLATCRRCSELFAGYRQFRTALRREAAAELGGMDPPDWASVLQARRLARTSNKTAAAALSPRRKSTSPAQRSRTYRRLSVAFLAVVLVGFAALFGYRQYGVVKAQSFVHSDTVAFVDSLVSAPFFSTATGSPASMGVDPSWFDATNAYPLSPASTSSHAGSQGAFSLPGP